ncbi:ABC transporter ATP-binding protein [Candidatus Entotheonella palauensis]|uniref:ABC transporter ATP-binding protein n=1 Tax=Candidatus Entotheonella palauensis TaxID=93172 RepID=UPI000B7F8590|nr:ABC transporter ATP-binding protein [Candidatus Entotheonella palauensis]
MLQVHEIDSYYGQAKILHGLSMWVSKGQVSALLGRNGAGKSTTLKSIIGLVQPRAGRITFNEQSIRGLRPSDIARAGIGYVPEERRIFASLTVTENLEVGRQVRRADTPYWTPDKLYGLFPNLGRMQSRLGGQMSGGEQQMLAIARTLMGNPSLLLLDEPSEGLAPVIVEEMATAIINLKGEGLTVVLSEQNTHFATLMADTAYIIEQGEIKFNGTMKALIASPEVREKFLSA